MQRKAVFLFLLLFTVLFSFFLLTDPDTVSESMMLAMRTSVYTVIPSLFPFMVVAKLITGMGILDYASRVLEKPLYRMFGIGGKSISGILMGYISGFPVGGSVICDLSKKGEISKEEAEKAISLSHNTGPAFPVSVVGAALWGCKSFGVLVYLSQIMSSLLTGIILFGRKKNDKERKKYDHCKVHRKHFLSLLSEAVSSSAVSCVKITGYICFFKILTDMIITYSGGKLLLEAILSSVFEFSSGVSAGARLGGSIGAAVTGFSVGFSGISALMQVASFAFESGISMKKCAVFKLLQGFICSGLCVLSYFFEKTNVIMKTQEAQKTILFLNKNATTDAIISLTVIVIALFRLIHKTRKNKCTDKY